MPRATIRGPVLLQAAERLASHRIDPADQSDVETYWDLVFAAAHQHSVIEFRERSDRGLESVARALDARLGQGWLAGNGLRSPQTVYTCSAEVHAFSVENPVDERLGGKPVGALWTSSMLPDGVSAWQRSEWSEFPGQGRRPKLLHVGPDDLDHVYAIRDVGDVARLVADYPRRVSGDQVAVDWVRVARDFVAVQLTAAGLARAQNHQVETDAGYAMLRGWDAECTAWLRPPSSARLSEGDAAESLTW